MKIYRYDHETGIYQGEDFSDQAFSLTEACVVSEDATTIASPQCRHHKIPVFDLNEKVISISPFSGDKLKAVTFTVHRLFYFNNLLW